jgi:hypothetical protein
MARPIIHRVPPLARAFAPGDRHVNQCPSDPAAGHRQGGSRRPHPAQASAAHFFTRPSTAVTSLSWSRTGTARARPRWTTPSVGSSAAGRRSVRSTSVSSRRCDILLRVLGLHAAPRRRCLLGRRARARSAHHERNDARPCDPHEPVVPPRRWALAPAPSPRLDRRSGHAGTHQAAVGRTAS